MRTSKFSAQFMNIFFISETQTASKTNENVKEKLPSTYSALALWRRCQYRF